MVCGSHCSLDPVSGRGRRWLGVALLGLALAACAREPFRVRPKTDPPVPETSAVAVTETDYLLRARAVWDGNELVDRFDANHLTAGMLPVYVWLEARTAVLLDLKLLRFRLRDAAGRTWRHLSVKQSERRLMKSYGVRAYSVDGYRTFRQHYADLCFPTTGTLAAGARADGFLFFEIPRARRDLPAGDIWLELEWRTPGPRRVTRIELPVPDVVTSSETKAQV